MTTAINSAPEAFAYRSSKVSVPVLGVGHTVGDKIGEGDTYLVENVLPPDLAEVGFENLMKEVAWNVMRHRGGEVPRLVAVQGEIDANVNYPIYRHPADESPPLRAFSATVSAIRAHVEHTLQHPVNHVLIQLYRTGADYISEHSDKTIDVVRGSRIVNLSLGSRRTMTLRTKKDAAATTTGSEQGANGEGNSRDGGGDGGAPVQRTTQRIPLPHNSLFVMGLATNSRWMHSVHTDKRPENTKDPAERGPRISLTFRHIGTFLTPSPSPAGQEQEQEQQEQQLIFGQGATGKTRAEARPVVRGGEEAERLLAAFGAENHESEFDWEKVYGEGFDVLHFAATTPASV
ncbi:hypothetical protein DFH94DRAFT_858381 [Russula ochroleuca]|jgi:alkylated DNA repair dioxygenase AlkB|uniref:Fe2OG dioxygenase domain-containing protein n=1 Tax=Russula ochroleuca TaxID=152965 RepID=A0A9P5JU51_9AGAM|nr:hypothetical protein DFH94DRAFT_858381 [Russula ochroleuca]